MSGFRSIVAAVAVSVLAACSQAHVKTMQSYSGPVLARPDRVVVANFSISPEQVRLDQGIGARIMRAVDDAPLSSEEWQAAQATQAALAERMVERLRKYGLPAELGSPGPAAGVDLLVEGQIVGIDQGNRTRRVLIGLGAGKSTVTADAQLYYASGGSPPHFLSGFEGQADSGRAPGAAETAGAGAAADRLATSAALSGAMHGTAEVRRASDTAEAGKLADGLARQIAEFAVARGWIPPAAIE